MNRLLISRLAVVMLLTASAAPAVAQSLGQSRAVPNPVPQGGGRVNIWSPNRGQGGGQFGAPRSNGRTHAGIDVTADVGTPVQAVAPGRVIRSESSAPYCVAPSPDAPFRSPADILRTERRLAVTTGNNIVIQHADGTTSYNYHLNGESQPQVGDRVVAGQIIGSVGRSGNVPQRADSHLHFEMRDANGLPIPPAIEDIRSTQPNTQASPIVTPRQSGTSSPTASIRMPAGPARRLAF